MGLLSFISALQNNSLEKQRLDQSASQAELERQARLTEIEARKRAAIEENAAQLENARKQGDITTVANQHMLSQAISKVLQSQHTGGYSGLPTLTPEELQAQTGTEFAKTIAANPMASSALDMSKMNQLQGGAVYDRQIGALGGQNALAGGQANLAKNRLSEAVDTRSLLTRPNRTSAEDLAATEQAGFNTDFTHGMRSSAVPMAQSQAQSGITGNQLNAAKNIYGKNEVEKLDPGLAAQAEMADQKAKISDSSFMEQLGMPANVLGASDQSVLGQALYGLKQRGIANPVTSALINRLNLPRKSAPVSTNTLTSPLTSPLFNINQ